MANNSQGLSALYSGVLQSLSMIQSADNAVDSKAAGVVAFSLAVIALIVEKTEIWHALTIFGLLVLAAALSLALWCVRIRNHQSATVRLSDHPEYLNKDDAELIKQLIADTESAIDDGNAKLDHKASIFLWSMALFVVGTLIGVLSFKLRIAVI